MQVLNPKRFVIAWRPIVTLRIKRNLKWSSEAVMPSGTRPSSECVKRFARRLQALQARLCRQLSGDLS